MAESIIVHFVDCELLSLEKALGVPLDEARCTVKDDVLFIYDCDGIEAEYEPDEWNLLVQKLGKIPSVSLCFELRRSKQRQACQLTKSLLKGALAQFDFVVDDDLGRIWGKDEFADVAFLADYSQSSKLNNCLRGGAVGDALGLPFEGLSAQRADKFFKDKRAYNFIPWVNLGMVSDDTEHAVMTVQAWIASRDADAERAHRQFRTRLRWHLRWWLLGLPAGIGMATGKSLFKLWAFLPNSGVFSAGNGPAMRASVLGVLIDDLGELKRYVHTSTTISHTDSKAVQGALAIALSAHYFARYESIAPDALLAFVCENLADAELIGYLQSAQQSAVHSDRQSAGQDVTLSDWMQTTFGKREVTGYMYHTVPAVFFAVCRYPTDPMRGLELLIRAGGDVDTTCAIAGGILGVKYGEEMARAVKGKWLEPKITPAFLQKLSDQAHIAKETQIAQCPARFGGVVTLLRNMVFLVIVLVHGVRRLFPPY